MESLLCSNRSSPLPKRFTKSTVSSKLHALVGSVDALAVAVRPLSTGVSAVSALLTPLLLLLYI